MLKRASYVESVEQDRPRTIYFYATSHCNSNCAYCIFRMSNHNLPRVHMPLAAIERIWGESEILQSCGIVVQGGEFTIHPEARGIMKYFGSKLRKVTLLTNAVDPFLALDLVEHANQVTVSVDGPHHDKTRGVQGNLTNIMTFLQHMNGNHDDKLLTLQMTLGPWNAKRTSQAIDNLEWFLDTCLTYNAQPRFNIASDDGLLGTATYSQKMDVLSDIERYLAVSASVKEYTPLAKSLRSGVEYIGTAISKTLGKRIPCYSTSIYSTINADGSVWMCQGLSEKEATVGNVHVKPFDVIWSEAAEKRKRYKWCQDCTLSCQLIGDISFMNASKTYAL